MIRTVFSLPEKFSVLIVDDNSPDGTAQIIKDLQKEFPGSLFLLERQGKQGLGTAYIAGFRWALDKGYEYIFEMDADFSHNPQDLMRLSYACKEGAADVAVGSRYISGGKVVNWPVSRVMISYFASIYVRMVTFIPVRDTTAGFICYKRKVLQTIDLDKIQFVGYAFQVEMKFAAWQAGFKIAEVPITFVDRIAGVSKMSSGIIKEAALGVLKIRMKGFLSKYY